MSIQELRISSSGSTVNNEICFTSACIETASSILQSIDMNIDPCSDFYKYACM